MTIIIKAWRNTTCC